MRAGVRTPLTVAARISDNGPLKNVAEASSENDIDHTQNGVLAAVLYNSTIHCPLGLMRLPASPTHPVRRRLLMAQDRSSFRTFWIGEGDRAFVLQSRRVLSSLLPK